MSTMPAPAPELTAAQQELISRMQKERREARVKSPRPIKERVKQAREWNTRDWQTDYEVKARDWMYQADSDCAKCSGYGITRVSGYPVCDCVFRGIFAQARAKYLKCGIRLDVSLMQPTKRGVTFGFVNAEYRADLISICKGALRPTDWLILFHHSLLRKTWTQCLEILPTPLDRGQFFNAVRRIELLCGRAIRFHAPYSVFPIEDYFTSIPKRLGIQ